MKICLIVIAIIFVNSQLPDQPFPKFGLLTVTHTRGGSFETILDYIKFYTQTPCYEQLLSQICIIWNNQQLPQDVGLLNRELFWRVPVYFHLTNNNSLNHRFRIPKQANAEVFYSLDDDIRVDCDTLNTTYQHFAKAKTSNFQKIVSNQVRNYGYFIEEDTQFYYQGHSYAKFYTIAETGASFYPKHYLNLYYLKLQELSMFRERVQILTSCQDIFFMAVSQHFYPEMSPQYYKPFKNYKNTDPKVGLSRKKGLVPLRTSCISYLSQVLGYNPLRHYNKNASRYLNNWQFPNMNIIMQTKIQGLINVDMVQAQERNLSNTHQFQGQVQSETTLKQYINIAQNMVEDEQQQIEQDDTQMAKQEAYGKRQQLQKHENFKQQDKKDYFPPSKSENKSQISKYTLQSQISSDEQIDQLKQKREYWAFKKLFLIIILILLILIIILIACLYRLFQKYIQLKQNTNANSALEQQQIGVIYQQS